MLKTSYQVFSILCLLLTFKTGQACKCPPLQALNQKVIEGYDIIFKGTTDSVSVCDGEKSKAYFTITELFKGKSTQQIALSFDCNTDCQMSFEKGETWLIYGKFYKYGQYQVSLCSRSRKQFADKEKDIYFTASGISFEDELHFLHENLNSQSFIEEPKPMDHTNTQPEGLTKIWLVLISAVFLGGFYFWLGRKRN